MGKFTAPKDTTFKPQGENRVASFTPVDGGDTVQLDVTYGLIVADDTGEVKGHRFVVSRTEEIMGREVEMSAGSTSVEKAIEMFLKQNNVGEPDEFDITYDEEDEFFSQKYKAKTEDKDDVWKAAKFAENREELNALRGQTENLLETAREAETGTQDDWLAVANVLVHAYDLVGNSRKALKSWAEGATGEDNLTLLTQLGKGDNALTEAMRLAQLTETEYAVLPASVTSGKAVDRHIAQSVKEIVDGAALNKTGDYPTVNFDGDIPTVDGAEVLLRRVAQVSFGVTDATEVDDNGEFVRGLSSIIDAVDAKAGEFFVEFREKYGKHVNTYNSDQYAAAKLAFGAVRISTKGASLFKSAVEAFDAYDAEEDADKKKDILARMFAKTAGNALLKEAASKYRSHADTVSREKTQRAALKAVDGDNVHKVSKTAFNALEPLAAAAHLYYMASKHPASDDVVAELKKLLAQGISIPGATAAE